MSEPVLLSDCKVWMGGYDFTGSLNMVDMPMSKAELPNGRFGDTAEVMFPGLEQVTATMKGFWSAGSLEPDSVIFPLQIDPAVTPAAWPLTFAPPNTPGNAGAVGSFCYSIVGHEFSYKLGAPHGQLFPYEVTTKPGTTYATYRQQIASAKTLVTATTTGTAITLGLLGVTQKLVVVLHVFAITGGSWVLTVESDDNAPFATPTTRLTMAAVTTAPFRIVQSVNGAVATDTFWRVVMTKTGGTDLTYAVSFSFANL